MSRRAVFFSLVLLFSCASTGSAAEKGMLYVKSEPPGAKVFVDGEERGTTPAFFRDVQPGRRVVELRLAGTQPVRQIVIVEAAKIAKVNVEISPAPARLTVISDPLDATVLLDGEERGETPLTIQRVEPGTHEVIVYRDDYERAVRNVEVKPGENRVLKISLRPKGTAAVSESASAQPAVIDEVEKRLARILGEFEAFIKKADYVGARGLAERGAGRDEFAEIALQLRAAAKVACALEDRREAIRSGARALVGQDVTFQAKAGPRKGKVEEVTEEGISLAAQIRAGGRVAGTTSFTLPWSDLTPAQEELLAKEWDRDIAEGKIAAAFLALSQRDLAAAGKAVYAAGSHPLGDYVRKRIEAVKRAPSEAAARKAWGEVEELAGDPGLSPAEAKKLSAMLDSFEKRHGRTEHAASVRGRIAEARKAARSAPARAVGAPPDAVEFRGHYYKLFQQGMTWHDAKSFCEEQGGHLVTITSTEENELVTGLARTAGSGAWIGFTDAEQEGKWEWVTGEKATFTGWDRGQPNDSGMQDFGLLSRLFAFRWDDVVTHETYFPICEWEPSASGRPPSRVAEVERALGYRLGRHPRDAGEFQGHYYKVFRGRMTWAKAKTRCMRAGGYLACVQGKEEADFLFQLVRDSDSHDVMIGGVKRRGAWQWIDGSPFEFAAWSGWAQGRSHTREDGYCIVIWGMPAGQPGMWNASKGTGHSIGGYICEWER